MNEHERRDGWTRKLAHYRSRARVPEEVQLSVDVPDLIPGGPRGPEEGDNISCGILQLQVVNPSITCQIRQRPRSEHTKTSGELEDGRQRYCRPSGALKIRAPCMMEMSVASGGEKRCAVRYVPGSEDQGGRGRTSAPHSGKRKQGNMISQRVRVSSDCIVLTLPITARPRPPLEAHSSFATRSSLLARTARQRVVVLCPLPLTTVCDALSGMGKRRRKKRTEPRSGRERPRC